MKKILTAVIAVFMVMSLASCAKSYDEQQAEADFCAKKVCSSIESAINDNPDLFLDKYEIRNTSDGSTTVSFNSETSTNISKWFGEDFEGYFYAYIDCDRRSVDSAIWSADEIDIDYYDYVGETKAYYDGTEHVLGYWSYLQ